MYTTNADIARHVIGKHRVSLDANMTLTRFENMKAPLQIRTSNLAYILYVKIGLFVSQSILTVERYNLNVLNPYRTLYKVRNMA